MSPVSKRRPDEGVMAWVERLRREAGREEPEPVLQLTPEDEIRAHGMGVVVE